MDVIDRLYQRAAEKDASALESLKADYRILANILVPFGIEGITGRHLLDAIRGKLDYEICGAHLGYLQKTGILWFTRGETADETRVGLTLAGLGEL
jgi:hypothetical protein